MSTKRAIAIFVKTPGLSPLKTRLAAGVGKDKALEFYALALDCVEELANAIGATPHWAVGEEDGLSDERWQSFDRLWTGEGGLGDRQHHIYSTLLQQYDEIMLIGTDCPQLTAEGTGAAFNALKTHNFAIGPAQDGGYTYITGNKDIPLESWKSVRYSESDTLKNLLNHLNGSHKLLQQYSDVDHKEDLQTVLNEMPNARSKTQQKMIDWIQTL